ncbi:hypothetical protein FH972_026196 [Carpinus fangiana]|uniref:Uncharacterized protein n=1 Tax=Carpinus fangiana TaxID=176857 RepID=A0A5N6L394_9ROSI|nr:hypothetical protein FH972_026196 [Carpinus fangiana]
MLRIMTSKPIVTTTKSPKPNQPRTMAVVPTPLFTLPLPKSCAICAAATDAVCCQSTLTSTKMEEMKMRASAACETGREGNGLTSTSEPVLGSGSSCQPGKVASRMKEIGEDDAVLEGAGDPDQVQRILVDSDLCCKARGIVAAEERSNEIRNMSGMSGDEEEHPANSSAKLPRQSLHDGMWATIAELTKQDDRYGDQDHEHMMVAQEGYYPVDANGESEVAHGGCRNCEFVLCSSNDPPVPAGPRNELGGGDVVCLSQTELGEECSIMLRSFSLGRDGGNQGFENGGCPRTEGEKEDQGDSSVVEKLFLVIALRQMVGGGELMLVAGGASAGLVTLLSPFGAARALSGRAHASARPTRHPSLPPAACLHPGDPTPFSRQKSPKQH